MKIEYKALLYDIANMAYVIADTGRDSLHSLHRVRDIVEDGNIDRVSRVLGLAYVQVINILSPLLRSPRVDICKDFSAKPRDYVLNFRNDRGCSFSLTKEIKLHIKETVHEYMVCMVLADWLGITLPEASDVWKFRAEGCLTALRETCAEIADSYTAGFRRKVSPI